MVICFIALIVFAVLGIFSATHRIIAKEAFECVFLKMTLRPCKSGLDRRLKSQITGKLLRRTPKTGKFVYKHFEAISLIFTIIMILSLVYSAFSIYNYFVFGNCEGEQATGPCIYNQIGDAVSGATTIETTPEACEIPQPVNGTIDSGGTSGT